MSRKPGESNLDHAERTMGRIAEAYRKGRGVHLDAADVAALGNAGVFPADSTAEKYRAARTEAPFS